MMASFILCLLPALLATTTAVESLTCEVCSGTAADCKNPQSTCTSGATGGCFTAAEENTLGGTKTSTFYKGCVDDYNSGIKVPITFTVGDKKYLKVNTALCNDANGCNSAVLDVPKENTTLNGQQCPTCFALNSDTCTGPTIPCRGDETHCIDFAGTRTTGSSTLDIKFVVKGCASESTKDLKPGNILYPAASMYKFDKGSSNFAETTTAAPKSTTTAAAEATTPTPKATTTTTTTKATTTTTTTKATTTTTTTKATTATTSGGSPALGKFSFALFLPGLAGLLLLKLLS